MFRQLMLCFLLMVGCCVSAPAQAVTPKITPVVVPGDIIEGGAQVFGSLHAIGNSKGTVALTIISQIGFGVYTKTLDGKLQRIAFQGEATPSGHAIDIPVLLGFNDRGQVLVGDIPRASSEIRALYLWDAGVLRRIAGIGDMTPLGGTYSYLSYGGALNNLGQVSFTGRVSNSEKLSGVFIYKEGQTTAAASFGQTSKVGGTLIAFYDSVVDDSGDVAFLALAQDSIRRARHVILRTSPGGSELKLLAHTDLVISSEIPALFELELLDFNNGRATFRNRDAQGKDQGLFVATSEGVRRLVATNSSTPAPAKPLLVGESSNLDGEGSFVFEASETQDPEPLQRSLWLWDNRTNERIPLLLPGALTQDGDHIDNPFLTRTRLGHAYTGSEVIFRAKSTKTGQGVYRLSFAPRIPIITQVTYEHKLLTLTVDGLPAQATVEVIVNGQTIKKLVTALGSHQVQVKGKRQKLHLKRNQPNAVIIKSNGIASQPFLFEL